MQRIQRSPLSLETPTRPSAATGVDRTKKPQPATSMHPRAGTLWLVDETKRRTTKSSASSARTLFEKSVRGIFNWMSFKPLSMKKLQAQGLDFESAKSKMQEQGIKNVEIILVPKSHVQILYAKHPNEASDPKLAVFIAGQNGKVVKHVNTGEVLKNWQEGKSICLTSVRGYMGNPGKPDHKGQADDLAKILEYLHGEKRIAAENTELYAHSMGCDTLTNALAVRATQREGLDLDEEVYKKINLRAPYTNLMEMVMHKIDTKWFLRSFRSKKDKVNAALQPLIVNSFPHLKHLKAQKIRIAASEADEKVPFIMSKTVRDELDRLNLPPGADLNDPSLRTPVSLLIHPKHDRMNHEATCFYHDQ